MFIHRTFLTLQLRAKHRPEPMRLKLMREAAPPSRSSRWDRDRPGRSHVMTAPQCWRGAPGAREGATDFWPPAGLREGWGLKPWQEFTCLARGRGGGRSKFSSWTQVPSDYILARVADKEPTEVGSSLLFSLLPREMLMNSSGQKAGERKEETG